MSDETLNPRETIEQFLADVTKMREQVADVEIPGWVIGHPSMSELTEDLVTVVARSKEGELVPFFPPSSTEVVVTVLEGRVQVQSGRTATFVGRKFFILTAAQEEHGIMPLEHPCRIFCTFFRTGVAAGGEQPMVAR
jgi:hypothetical protein